MEIFGLAFAEVVVKVDAELLSEQRLCIADKRGTYSTQAVSESAAEASTASAALEEIGM